MKSLIIDKIKIQVPNFKYIFSAVNNITIKEGIKERIILENKEYFPDMFYSKVN